MRAIAVAIGLKPAFFNNYIGEKSNIFRRLYYPALQKDTFNNKKKYANAYY